MTDPTGNNYAGVTAHITAEVVSVTPGTVILVDAHGTQFMVPNSGKNRFDNVLHICLQKLCNE